MNENCVWFSVLITVVFDLGGIQSLLVTTFFISPKIQCLEAAHSIYT